MQLQGDGDENFEKHKVKVGDRTTKRRRGILRFELIRFLSIQSNLIDSSRVAAVSVANPIDAFCTKLKFVTF